MIFYEEKYAKELLKNGFSSFMNKTELSILAKYFKHIGQNKKQIEKSLIEFCVKFNSDYNEILSRNKIDYAIRSSDKYGLRFPMDVVVTKDEMYVIKNCGDYKRQKILFVMLVVAKYLKYNNTRLIKEKNYVENDFFINETFINILKMAKVNASRNERKQMLYDLEQKKLITSKKNRNKDKGGVSYKINFVSENSDSEIIVNDMNDITKFYPFYCERCGRIVKNKSKRHNLCQACYQEKRKKTSREIMRNKRNVSR